MYFRRRFLSSNISKQMITKNLVKQVASLRQQKFRKELGLFVVEGRKMVEELFRSGFETVGLYATQTFLADYPVFAEAETVSEVQMEQMSGQDTPPGILAVVRIPQQGEIEPRSKFVLALDGIANPGNMGTLIRTAEWFGIRDVVCSMDCVELWNPKQNGASHHGLAVQGEDLENRFAYISAKVKKQGQGGLWCFARWAEPVSDEGKARGLHRHRERVARHPQGGAALHHASNYHPAHGWQRNRIAERCRGWSHHFSRNDSIDGIASQEIFQKSY